MKHDRKATNPAVISWFDDFGDDDRPNPYAFLSNFYEAAPLIRDGVSYATGEHLFQALKAANFVDHEAVRLAKGPGGAKSTGRSIRLRTDWERVKYDVMVLTLNIKFTLDRPEGQLLLDTGDALLVEGTWWHDTVWGVDLSAAGAASPWQRPGRNWLGRLLMARRAELRSEQIFGVSADIGLIDSFAGPRREKGAAIWLNGRAVVDDPEWMYSDDIDLRFAPTSGSDTSARIHLTVRTPFCDDSPDGGCETSYHVHTDPAADVSPCDHEAWEEDTNGIPIRCVECGHSFDAAEQTARSAWSAVVAPGPVEIAGRLSHAMCDHANSKNARARCCRRYLKGSKP